jgi:hypothetical protein
MSSNDVESRETTKHSLTTKNDYGAAFWSKRKTALANRSIDYPSVSLGIGISPA